MSENKQNIRIPQPKNHEKNTSCKNISRHNRKTAICCPTCRIFNITNFQNFQVIDTSNQTISQSNKNKSIKSFCHTFPKNSCFPQKSIHWRLTCLTYYKNCPSHCNSCGTLILTFQIPKKLRAGKFVKRRSYDFIHNQTPNTEINDNIENYVTPENTNTYVMRSKHRISKQSIKSKFQIHSFWGTLRHKKQSHMPNTTISKQSFQICLSLWCNCPNNHRKSSKECQSTSKISSPNSLPMMSPKSEYGNFRLHCNPKEKQKTTLLGKHQVPKNEVELLPISKANLYSPTKYPMPKARKVHFLFYSPNFQDEKDLSPLFANR